MSTLHASRRAIADEVAQAEADVEEHTSALKRAKRRLAGLKRAQKALDEAEKEPDGITLQDGIRFVEQAHAAHPELDVTTSEGSPFLRALNDVVRAERGSASGIGIVRDQAVAAFGERQNGVQKSTEAAS